MFPNVLKKFLLKPKVKIALILAIITLVVIGVLFASYHLKKTKKSPTLKVGNTEMENWGAGYENRINYSR